MKTNKIATAFILAFAMIGTGFAQTSTTPTTTSPTVAVPPPTSLPTQNIGKLRAYAFSQVGGSYSSIWGESVMFAQSSKTEVYFRPQIKPTYEEALRQLNTTSFQFKVADKAKSLSVFSELLNKDGMTLFLGSANASVSEQGAILCSGVKMQLNSEVPIYVGPNVPGASIRIGNDWVHADVYNGYLMFQQGYAEKDGMVILQYNDGIETRQIPYSILLGVQIPLTSVSGTISNWVQDFQTINDDGMVSGATLNVGAYGYVGDGHEAPVVCVKITSARTVKFGGTIYDVYTNNILENPLAGGLIMPNNTENPIALTAGQWSTGMLLQPGTYYFYLKTDFFDVPMPVIYYGGKG